VTVTVSPACSAKEIAVGPAAFSNPPSDVDSIVGSIGCQFPASSRKFYGVSNARVVSVPSGLA
jgi:hypothetical protein